MLGLFDKPISSRLILSNPSLYQTFQQIAFSNFVGFLVLLFILSNNFMLFCKFKFNSILEICFMDSTFDMAFFVTFFFDLWFYHA